LGRCQLGGAGNRRRILNVRNWPKHLLDGLAEEGVAFLPYLPDGVLAPVIKLAEASPGFTLVPLTDAATEQRVRRERRAMP
jgi:hypothetical protein